MSLELIIADKRKRMKEIEIDYLRAREYLNSPGFTIDKNKTLDKLIDILRLDRFASKNGLEIDANRSILVLGRAQQVIFDFEHVYLIISEYESLRESVRKASENGKVA